MPLRYDHVGAWPDGQPRIEAKFEGEPLPTDGLDDAYSAQDELAPARGLFHALTIMLMFGGLLALVCAFAGGR